jgi:hypothetical protein
MRQSLLLPLVGCSVVAILLLLSASERLAAQPANVDPREPDFVREAREGAWQQMLREKDRRWEEERQKRMRDLAPKSDLMERFRYYVMLVGLFILISTMAVAGFLYLVDRLYELLVRRKRS